MRGQIAVGLEGVGEPTPGVRDGAREIFLGGINLFTYLVLFMLSMSSVRADSEIEHIVKTAIMVAILTKPLKYGIFVRTATMIAALSHSS